MPKPLSKRSAMQPRIPNPKNIQLSSPTKPSSRIAMYPLSCTLIPELSPTHFSAQTNELLHHYIWWISMPLLGISHPFVLSGLIALSALHLSSLKPSRRRSLLSYAASQESAALPSFRAATTDRRAETIDAVFAFAGNAICHVMAAPRDVHGREIWQRQPDPRRPPCRKDGHAQ